MLMFSSLIATYFLIQGIWMILPFTIIELTALGIALLIYARHALDYESIAIDGSSVTVEKNIGGKLERHEFNTKWLQLKQEEDGKRLIRIEQSDQELPIGIFVPVDARAQFFKDLHQQIRCES
jgi:uncharacterized membrane protein